MSEKNSREAKRARRKAKDEKPLGEYRPVRYGICRQCGEAGFCYEPAVICGPCCEELANGL